MADADASTEASSKDFEEPPTTPDEWAKYWANEFKAAKLELKSWHKDATEAERAFMVEKHPQLDIRPLGLFTSNVETQEAILFGRTPHTDVTRKFGDSMDEVARVAAEMMERNLDGDLEGPNGGSVEFRNCLRDRLRAGMGLPRLRYVMEEHREDVPPIHKKGDDGESVLDEQTGAPVEMAPGYQKGSKSHEAVETIYCHWRDILYSPARTFEETRWWAFRAPMTRRELVQRFGPIGKLCPLNTKKRSDDRDARAHDPRQQADVWEVWDKESKQVFWYVEGFGKVLDSEEDPLELENFWPFPRPMVGIVSTEKFVPKPDYTIAKRLYVECDMLAQRISDLEEAVGVKGLYPNDLGDAVSEMVEYQGNKLYAVSNFQQLLERGGVKELIQWWPLDMVVAAIGQLKQALTDKMSLLFQITGMSDIMRGQAQAQTTATEQAIKAKFASVRMQSLQDEFARLVSDSQRIKAEIIAKHFDAQTIINRSNISRTPDAQLAQQAVQLIQAGWENWRVEVKPEAVSLTDYAALKQERVEVLTSLGAFFQSVMPMVQMAGPAIMPFVLQMAQWLLSGIKGASTMEGLFDEAVTQAKTAAQQAQAPQQQKPDPKMAVEQLKGQMAMQHTQQELQADLARTQAETQAQAALEEHSAVTDVRKTEATERIKAMHSINQLQTPGGAA